MRAIPEISDTDLAFPTKGAELLPKWDEIPEEFKIHKKTPESRFFNKVFYDGSQKKCFREKEGVDKVKALRVLRAIMGDWGISHEHKEAGWSMLFREWFEFVE